MRKLYLLLLSALLLANCAGKNDEALQPNEQDPLAERIEALQSSLTAINDDLGRYQTLLEGVNGKRQVSEISESQEGVTISYNDGKKVSIKFTAATTTTPSGEAGKIALPLLKIDPTDGYWYLSCNGTSWELIRNKENKPLLGLNLTGQWGEIVSTPKLGINEQGCWTLDARDGRGAQPLTDAEAHPVAADLDKVPAGLFLAAERSDDALALKITLLTGETLSIPTVSDSWLFSLSVGQQEHFSTNQTRSFALTQRGITEPIVESPEGWRVEIKEHSVEVTAPNQSSSGTITISMMVGKNRVELVSFGVSCEAPVVGTVDPTALYGYGAQTTGGEGATAANSHHFNSGTAFRDWLKLREKNKSTTPAIVWLSGTFTAADGRDSGSPWFDIKRTSNISIYGTDSFKMQHVGFFLKEAQNIIIRNIYIVMPKADNGADGISMQESSNVWVDHCTFESANQEKDYEDGSCDITHATKNVTVSWCHYIKTQKSSLVGHSNSASEDVAITATFHHNFFDGSSSRHPRVRFGRVHVYNNFYNGCTTYGVGSAYRAMVLVEHNAFDNVHLPTDICTFPAKQSGSSWVSNLTGSVAGYLYAENNSFTNKPANSSNPYPFTNVEWKAYNGEKLATPLVYTDFKPSYSYPYDAADEVAAIVRSGAGVGKMQGFGSAPYAADNGTGQ